MFVSSFSSYFHCAWATFSIISTGLIFNEFQSMGIATIIVFVFGLSVSYLGVTLLARKQLQNSNQAIYKSLFANHQQIEQLESRFIVDTKEPHSVI